MWRGLLAGLLLVGAAQAADRKTFSVGVEDYRNWLPYSEVRNGVYGGLGRDILDAFVRQKGYSFTYEIYPLKRRDHQFVDGQVDLAFPDNPNWVVEMKKELKISYAPVLEFTDGVLVRPENLGRGVGHCPSLLDPDPQAAACAGAVRPGPATCFRPVVPVLAQIPQTD